MSTRYGEQANEMRQMDATIVNTAEVPRTRATGEVKEYGRPRRFNHRSVSRTRSGTWLDTQTKNEKFVAKYQRQRKISKDEQRANRKKGNENRYKQRQGKKSGNQDWRRAAQADREERERRLQDQRSAIERTKQKVRCSYCGKRGHTQKECWMKREHDLQRRALRRAHTRQRCMPQVDMQSMAAGAQKCNYCFRPGHKDRICKMRVLHRSQMENLRESHMKQRTGSSASRRPGNRYRKKWKQRKEKQERRKIRPKERRRRGQKARRRGRGEVITRS